VLDTQKLTQDLIELKEKTKIRSVAVVLMHSYALPEHELQVGKIAE
jgi:N-methylhydantoinase A/oxoprolinase/acetone carboxylase beta subunit